MSNYCKNCNELAEEIERLQAEVGRLTSEVRNAQLIFEDALRAECFSKEWGRRIMGWLEFVGQVKP